MLTKYFFFFNDTATTEIYTLSLHDALPISRSGRQHGSVAEGLAGSGLRPVVEVAGRKAPGRDRLQRRPLRPAARKGRSEEHTSELQSRQYLVCRLLLEKKKQHTSCISEIHT